MAQQGLFTAGTSIEELLDKRRTRANDLQQSLMANAAQGAARPMEAQAYSLLGSSLGRALAGGMGGQDEQMDTLKDTEAKRQELAGQYEAVMNRGTPEQRLAFGNTLIQNNMGEQGSAIVLQAREEINVTAEATALQERSKALGEQLKETHPNTAKLLMRGDATEKLYEIGLKAHTSKETKGDDKASTAVENFAAFTVRRDTLAEDLANGDITQSMHDTRLATAQSIFGGGQDPRRTQVEKANAASMGSYLNESGVKNKNAGVDIARYQQSLAILDTGVYTGTGAEAVQSVRKFAVLMGFGGDPMQINDANIEQFRSNALESALKYVQQTSGAISEKEMTLFQQAAQGIEKTPAANRLLIETALKVAQWEKDRDIALNAWHTTAAKRNPPASEAKGFMTKWEKENKLDLAGVITNLKDIKENDMGATPMQSETLIGDLNDADRQYFNDNIPKGDEKE